MGISELLFIQKASVSIHINCHHHQMNYPCIHTSLPPEVSMLFRASYSVASVGRESRLYDTIIVSADNLQCNSDYESSPNLYDMATRFPDSLIGCLEKLGITL